MWFYKFQTFVLFQAGIPDASEMAEGSNGTSESNMAPGSPPSPARASTSSVDNDDLLSSPSTLSTG